MGGDLRGEPDPVQQVRRAAQGIADMEQQADQGGDPLQPSGYLMTPGVEQPPPKITQGRRM